MYIYMLSNFFNGWLVGFAVCQPLRSYIMPNPVHGVKYIGIN